MRDGKSFAGMAFVSLSVVLLALLSAVGLQTIIADLTHGDLVRECEQ